MDAAEVEIELKNEVHGKFSLIDLIKGSCVIFRGLSIGLKMIVEAIYSKYFRELSDTNPFVIVISLNPITK